ncbi:ATP synthase subunit O, mitochondrial-like [Alligator mississippiensis]|uniref:Oligomycin sensitivity conferral protein n=1 Tax=Alligator mississippiensis TaxID=8496 RepID=A0A151MA68_ALLMI|nr:ATP synthase subunit O, mitochondrial-like [Alligator mississippiensis]
MEVATGLSHKVCSFSTGIVCPSAQLIKLYGVEGHYATALYFAASKQKKLEQIEKELSQVSTVMRDPKLASVVLNPHIKSAIKKNL